MFFVICLNHERNSHPEKVFQGIARGKRLFRAGDSYRFFDATPHAEFLYACVRKTIEDDLPNEMLFLKSFDRFRAGIESMLDMPEHTLGILFGFLRQNGGRLSKRALDDEFAELTADEVTRIEELYRACFGERSA